MHQKMSKLMKHHEQFMKVRKAAVHGNKMPSLYAIIKTIGPERHLDDRDAMTAAETVKIVIGQRAFVPADP